MILLLDLDGTLTDTAHEKFKPLKDGLEETDVNQIPIISGAKEFVRELIEQGHNPIIISDSHPKYVNKIAENIFNIPALSLSQKPNPSKTLIYLQDTVPEWNIDNTIVVGDTWLDIELGRVLNLKTILTSFYKATSVENRDGIGQDWKHLKSGSTYYASTFNDIIEIIKNPLQNLLAVEAIFQNFNSSKAVKFKTTKYADRFIAYRALGRQQNGECDKYAVTDKYFEFHRPDRSRETLLKLANASSNFISHVQESMPSIIWDYFTYVSDKTTTQPPNKLYELFELVQTNVDKLKLINWKDEVEGSIRNQQDYQRRKEFVDNYIFLNDSIDLKDKNVIIIDDQFTTGGTAYSICGKFIQKGAKNILFITLFYLTSNVHSEKICPKCGTKLQVKINRTKGTKFLSCTPKQYGGIGCGDYIFNII
ncbi:hypothetical protein HYN48_13845 [Flavobacterium magnum]|uniref:Phosphoribosyltransferase domain-containing protein n=1 Tax=Flavobacterium magnum TaxID=2162713 RepID=A0A2S0RIX7_9FLAO|nr:hypothetical protein [Flavobacterium magnum]AWA31081.1 hypothetical protein HYN48_13845 [Flavobacterium magnum]